jgi:site-specific DNA-methyltransferase (adenine-specific)
MPEFEISDLTLHPACEQVPRMRDDEWARFVSDVNERGVQEPIVVQSGGVVLDGRHRLEAAKARGDRNIPGRLVEFDEKAQLEYIITSALLRRHLTDDQRSILGARFHKLISKAAKTERSAKAGKGNTKQKSKAVNLSDTVSDKSRPKVDTREKAAKQFGVPERKLRSASEIDKKDSNLADRVLTGDITLHQAKRAVRRQEKREQLEAKAKAARSNGARNPHSWEIHQGDCLEVLSSLPERSARLVFSDPPYNIGVDYGPHYDDSRPPDEFERWCMEWMTLVHRVLTDDGSFWLLMNHEWAYRLAYAAVEKVGFHIRQWITWFESFGENCSKKFNRCSRPLIWFTKSEGRFVFHPEAVNRPSDRQAKYGDKRADPGGKTWDDVWGIDPAIPRLVDNAKERIPEFPTQLPLALLTPIVGCASDPGDLVIDPFNGSGTTGEACLQLGRRYVGIEKNERFAELARMRLDAASSEVGNAA